MAYRVNARFTDGLVNGWLSDVVAAEVPHCGDTISVNRHGRDVQLCVTAVWTPSDKQKGASPVVMVEAREIEAAADKPVARA